MSAPFDQFQGQGQGQYPQDQYGQQEQPGFGAPQQAGQPEQETAGAKKKKRGYAAQAYDFGGGANAALGGQPQGGGQFQAAQAPAYGGGYGQQPEPQPLAQQGAPQYGTPITPGFPPAGGYGQQPQQPQQQYGGGVGYQAPDAGYPGPGAPNAGGVAGITQGVKDMGVGGPQLAMAPGSRPAVLNQLYPTDLLNQPFNVAELDLPPPPIVLPANVRHLKDQNAQSSTNIHTRPALPHPLPRIVNQNTFDPLSMLFPPHILCSRSRNYLSRLSFSHTLLCTMWTTQCRLYKTKSFPVVEDVDRTSILMSHSLTMAIDGDVTCVI